MRCFISIDCVVGSATKSADGSYDCYITDSPDACTRINSPDSVYFLKLFSSTVSGATDTTATSDATTTTDAVTTTSKATTTTDAATTTGAATTTTQATTSTTDATTGLYELVAVTSTDGSLQALKDACASEGLTPAVLTSPEDYQKVQSALGDSGAGSECWLGLNKVDNEWQFSDGTLFSNTGITITGADCPETSSIFILVEVKCPPTNRLTAACMNPTHSRVSLQEPLNNLRSGYPKRG
ncbi:C-type lectin fold [Trinorchestia longiramus]|nr:C-type lectin fold [Trinorchestia longiramus]